MFVLESNSFSILGSQQGFWSPSMMYDGSVVWATKGKIRKRNYQKISKAMYQTLSREKAHVGLNPTHQTNVDIGCWKKKALAQISAKYMLLFWCLNLRCAKHLENNYWWLVQSAGSWKMQMVQH